MFYKFHNQYLLCYTPQRFVNASTPPNRSSLGRLVDQSTMLLMVSIGTLILILALLILFHQNANATKGYELRTLERERSQLLLEEEVLKMQVAQAQALRNLKEDNIVLTMIPYDDPEYTQEEGTVAETP